VDIDSEEIEEFEKKYGTLSNWQKIIMLSLVILAALYELDITV
tara:strand:+ start:389 stop:517 length:129 start_codon:yes stop_codon:yes gene_type:complete